MSASSFSQLKPFLINKTIRLSYSFDRELFFSVDIDLPSVAVAKAKAIKQTHATMITKALIKKR